MAPQHAAPASATDDAARASSEGRRAPADFAALYELHFHDVCRWLRALGAPNGDLEDLAQEVFLVARRRFEGFDGRNAPGWLYQIARRVAGDARRRGWWRHLFNRRTEAPAPELPHAGPGPDEPLERREARQQLHALLAQMTENRRAVLVLVELEGCSTDEIAALEGITPAAVLSRLHYARRDLAALVDKAQRAERRAQDKSEERRPARGASHV